MDKLERLALTMRRIELWNGGATWVRVAELTDYRGCWRSLRNGVVKAATRRGITLRHGAVNAWSEDERATVRRMLEQGITAREIAKAIGRSRDAVLAWVQAHDLTLSNAHTWLASEARRAANMYRAGMTCKEIGARMGFTERAVHARLTKDGVVMRKRGGLNRCPDWATRYMLAREGWRMREIVWLLGLSCDPDTLSNGLRRYIKRSGLPAPTYSRKAADADRLHAMERRRLELRPDLRLRAG